MSNFDEKDQVSIARFILEHLPRHKHFVLATVDADAQPWAVCLNLSFDATFRVIWKSKKDTQHSAHISHNPNVSVCIFSQEKEIGDFGVYAKASAHEVIDVAELDHCINIRFRQKGKEIPAASKLLDDAPERIYIAEVRELWVNDSRHLKIPVDLPTLRDVFARDFTARDNK
ncbi:MAG: pyridoxamine 5-phosphate oxidase family protein [Candidatus Taylorbacteria bacterium]|nr:pyridoxamine 5-phosphate oxidase family protein [Candidatus Taylorbacteria bacterium]